jgi:hypothetical protein
MLVILCASRREGAGLQDQGFPPVFLVMVAFLVAGLAVVTQALTPDQLALQEILDYLIHVPGDTHQGFNPQFSEEVLSPRPHSPGNHDIDSLFFEKGRQHARLMGRGVDQGFSCDPVFLYLENRVMAAPAKMGRYLVLVS